MQHRLHCSKYVPAIRQSHTSSIIPRPSAFTGSSIAGNPIAGCNHYSGQSLAKRSIHNLIVFAVSPLLGQKSSRTGSFYSGNCLRRINTAPRVRRSSRLSSWNRLDRASRSIRRYHSPCAIEDLKTSFLGTRDMHAERLAIQEKFTTSSHQFPLPI